jgi:hypothetical protein
MINEEQNIRLVVASNFGPPVVVFDVFPGVDSGQLEVFQGTLIDDMAKLCSHHPC